MPLKDVNAEDFFLSKALEDPEHWEELAEQYPITDLDEIEPKRKRERRADPKDKRHKFDDDDWQTVQRNKKKYYDEYRENLKYAKELADEGM